MSEKTLVEKEIEQYEFAYLVTYGAFGTVSSILAVYLISFTFGLKPIDFSGYVFFFLISLIQLAYCTWKLRRLRDIEQEQI